jgi:primosomal protein N' (replication factor Y) (superfamily II helicase)
VAQYVEVCFETPQDATYFYSVPADFSEKISIGMRVKAPLGPRTLNGYLLRLVDEEEVRIELERKEALRQARKVSKSKADPASKKTTKKQQGLLFENQPPSLEIKAEVNPDCSSPDKMAQDPISKIRPLLKPADPEPYLNQRMLKLGRWMAGHYATSLGESLGALLPAAVKKHTKPENIRRVALELDIAQATELATKLKRRAPQQALILETLIECPQGLTVGELQLAADVGASAVRALSKKGHLSISEEYDQNRVFMGYKEEAKEDFKLTEDQSRVIAEITETMHSTPGCVHLIRGVTGSGKTEVYIRCAAQVVDRGQQAIILLPEISLTPQTCARFRGRFKTLAVLHSHLTAGQRAEEWRRIKAGKADVIIGARSAVFAPVPDLGLIVVDEEHENSYKQDSTPRYHARDAAVKRAAIEGAICLLGSATPSLESYQAALQKHYRLQHMDSRVPGRQLPPVEIIDTRREFQEKRFFIALSQRMRALLKNCLATDSSAIMFLNRRGWSTAIVCNRCGYVARCDHCQVALVFHRDRDASVCHYCGLEEKVGRVCPDCAQPGLRHIGLGTEKVAEQVRKYFPDAKVGRLDSDVMSKRTSHAHILSDFREGRLDVLVGTQMVGKGLDFPNVTLVGMISADTSLNLPDFRAAERTFQMVSQVAGRAGRGEKGGRVVVQTAMGDHLAIRAAAQHDYLGFAAAELDSRREHFWPPFARLVRVLLRGPDVEKVQAAAEVIAKKTRNCIDSLGQFLPGTRAPKLLGPAPCPLEFIDDNYRWHLLLKCPLGDWVEKIIPTIRLAASSRRGKVKATIDVDPGTML